MGCFSLQPFHKRKDSERTRISDFGISRCKFFFRGASLKRQVTKSLPPMSSWAWALPMLRAPFLGEFLHRLVLAGWVLWRKLYEIG